MIQERQYIKEAVYDWVAAVVAGEGRTDPVVWDHGDGPRPAAPFVALEFTGTSTPGSPNFGMVEVDPDNPDDQGVQEITRPVRRALTMYGFGEGAFDLLETIKESVYKDRYITMMALKGLVIPDALEVRENPAVRGVDTENGALFEFYVTYMRVMSDTPGWVETVHILPPDTIPMDEITNEEEEGTNG
jgi:hypothetical protein